MYSPPDPAEPRRNMELEAIARDVMNLGLRAVVPVLHVGLGVVYAGLPPLRRWPVLSPMDASACALAACEVVAHMLARGHRLSAYHGGAMRPVEGEGRVRLAWMIPGLRWEVLPTRQASGTKELVSDEEIEALFTGGTEAALLAQETRPRLLNMAAEQQAIINLFVNLGGPLTVELAQSGWGGSRCSNIVELARLLLAFVPAPEAWARRLAQLPVVDDGSLAPHAGFCCF